MQISDRLKLVSDFVTEGNILADIGTDHGYIPIYLILNGKIPYAYAMDVNKGPLIRAKENVKKYSLEDKITIRLSDGLEALNSKEADTVLIAGMGGELTLKILKNGKEILKDVRELVLSPHSEIHLIREYLLKNDYEITREDMIFDGGKYYTIIKAVRNKNADNVEYLKSKTYLEYGKLLVEENNNILFDYLLDRKNKLEDVILKIKENNNQIKRIEEINHEILEIDKLINSMKRG